MRPALALVLLAGCGPGFRVDDSFSSSFDLTLFGDYGQNRITSPYLREAAFQLAIVGRADQIADLSLASDDAGVLSVGSTQDDPDDEERRFAEVQAVGPGTAAVSVRDGRGRQRMAFDVRVGDPDRVSLHPVSRLVRDDEAPVATPTVVVGGRAEVEVHPFDGADRLSGAIHRPPASPAGLTVESSTYRASGVHDVLALSPGEAGAWTLSIPYAGGPIEAEVDAVVADTVAALALICMDDSEANAGDGLYCLSVATRADDTEVFGVAPTWDGDGAALDGAGDLLSYTWNGGAARAATATFGAVAATASVRGTDLRVSSTNDVAACATVGGVSPWAALLSLLLVFWRRAPRPPVGS